MIGNGGQPMMHNPEFRQLQQGELLDKRIQEKKEDPGVTLDQVETYLHLDDPDRYVDETEQAELWVLVLDMWRGLKGLLNTQDVPPRLLLQCIAFRYTQPRTSQTRRKGKDQ